MRLKSYPSFIADMTLLLWDPEWVGSRPLSLRVKELMRRPTGVQKSRIYGRASTFSQMSMSKLSSPERKS